MSNTETYRLIEARVPTPFLDKLLRGEIEKLEHLSQADKDTITALARVIFTEGIAVGKASVGISNFDGVFNL